MEKDDLLETADVYTKILMSALGELRSAFVDVVNKKDADITKFQEAIRRFDNTRALINSATNKCVVVGIAQFQIVFADLTGDPDRDLGQNQVDLPEI